MILIVLPAFSDYRPAFFGMRVPINGWCALHGWCALLTITATDVRLGAS